MFPVILLYQKMQSYKKVINEEYISLFLLNLYLRHFFPSAICSCLLTSETLSFPDWRIDLLLVWNCWCEMWSANPLIHISRHLCSHTNILFYRILNFYLVYPLPSSLKGPRQNFSVQYRYNIKQTNDENIENYQLGDY